MTKKEEIMKFLEEKVFEPILNSTTASQSAKKGVRYTMMRLEQRDAAGIRNYFWAAICGTDKSIDFAERLKEEGFIRFEDVLEEFRVRFDDKWLKKK